MGVGVGGKRTHTPNVSEKDFVKDLTAALC